MILIIRTKFVVVGNEVVETPPFEPNSNVQPLHQNPK